MADTEVFFSFVNKLKCISHTKNLYIQLVLFIFLCSVLSVWCKTDCKGTECYNGKCVNNETVCECFDGWEGSTCSQCFGRVRLSGDSGVITDGHGNYSEDKKCIWLLESDPPGLPIHFNANQFATECGWDHLYIFDGDSVFSPLIAAYSGLVSPEKNLNTTLPHMYMMAKSGKAYVYFYSDAAYNMTGFHLQYSVGGCSMNCSGNGQCVNGLCVCDDDHYGEFCQRASCPNNCSWPWGVCNTENGTCQCDVGYKGVDCSLSVQDESWMFLYNDNPPDGRASPASVLIRDEMWISGGYSFGQQTDFLVVYNITSGSWRTVTPLSTTNPGLLYGHSMVHYKDSLYVFGGVSGKHIESRLWVFNLTTSSWSYHDYNDTEALAGHTATLLNNTMYVIFGHSPVYGYMNRIHKLNLDSPESGWTLEETQGALMKGGYGHSSVYDSRTGEIYVYAGYNSNKNVNNNNNQYLLTDKLYSYNPVTKTWKILARSGSPRYLHSAVMLGDVMLVFGGNTHNDSSISHGAKCYSPDFMAYDPECNTWRYIKLKDLPPSAARYGHVAQPYTHSDGREHMYVFGGFTGLMLNDILDYEPVDCSKYGVNKTECLGSRSGRTCVWVVNQGFCMDRRQARDKGFEYESSPDCLPTKDAALYCSRESTCGSCLSTAYGCKWCDNNCTTTCSSKQYLVSNTSECPAKYNTVCSMIHNCHACDTYDSCKWDKKVCAFNDKTDFFDNGTDPTKSKKGKNPPRTDAAPGSIMNESVKAEKCDTPCYQHSSCENCTGNACMWCGSQRRCVETNSYVASFLYGQCQEWTTDVNKCAGTRCSELDSCDSCKLNPRCGWCNDPSDTGIGKCVEGSDTGPMVFNDTIDDYTVDFGVCPAERWFFIDCPLCQCNGHSGCTNVSDVCDECQDLTAGDHCQYCKDGYYGNPINGANCTACSCNNQADSCKNTTGQCNCRTRGVKGDKCDTCDSNYYGNPENGGTCYYDLRTDYQFTFNLSKPEDRHYKGINFMNRPTASDRDVDFTVNCSGVAYLNITWKSNSSPKEQYKVREYHCTYFRTKFEYKDFNFGESENVTFYVYVYGFDTPFWLQISFSQFPKIDLVHFFVTFFSCFLSLLIIAAVLYKIKHKYDSYRRRQRMIVEMEEMASRPFATALIEVDKKYDNCAAEKKDTNPDLRKRKRPSNKPGQVAIEPLHGQKAAVISLFVQMPCGEEEWTPDGNSGLAIGSALVTFGHQRKQSIEHGKNDKSKHKKHAFSTPDTCG